ncbi:related to putative S-adenosylmethionine-dependent methyltransferase of the seven beta-strand family [Melanopsichium pennsylvanicum]|uniref:S-adenosylmethionine-dependent methyltransferase of the seven beta-strand family n=2 Tax=Melanopsichium pennsylvanicum TaxID=63383 RepID=A0A077QSR7_9BASI|nr:conserved hypothetical protein [Melanopsichium pennsylvanicum 4]SNX82956.1 related to putative S-adenosylmethionine-dependent methyltransferase of the seven beta-strand family [Melanopsichium pennsylvanicum]
MTKVLALRVNPINCLPRIKNEPAAVDIFRALAHLAHLYSPKSLTRADTALYNDDREEYVCDQAAYQDAIDVCKVDESERRYAMHWLTRLIGSGLYWLEEDESDTTSPDMLLDLAGRVLGGHASLEEAGAITREFRFPLDEPVLLHKADATAHPAVLPLEIIEISLRDDPLPPSDSRSEANRNSGSGSSQDAAAAVGVQTWGASIIVSDVLVRHPTLFHPALACTSDTPLRIAELGAGTGLLGMATAKLLRQQKIQAHVVLTDYHLKVLENLRFNVDENFPASEATKAVSVAVEHLDWLELHRKQTEGFPEDRNLPKYDLLLLADVIYAPEHALWIRSSIEALLRKPTVDEANENAPRAHIIMAVRGSGKFEGLSDTVEEAFKPRARSEASVPLLSASSTATPSETMPGTPALVLEPVSGEGKTNAKHSDLLRSRIDAISFQEVSASAELKIVNRRRLDKRSSVGRNDEHGYLWFEITWCH